MMYSWKTADANSFSIASFPRYMVTFMIYISFETKQILLNFQVHEQFPPQKFGIFKRKMQADNGSNVTESMSHMIWEAEKL